MSENYLKAVRRYLAQTTFVETDLTCSFCPLKFYTNTGFQNHLNKNHRRENKKVPTKTIIGKYLSEATECIQL